jgi:hypothetical protein
MVIEQRRRVMVRPQRLKHPLSRGKPGMRLSISKGEAGTITQGEPGSHRDQKSEVRRQRSEVRGQRVRGSIAAKP